MLGRPCFRAGGGDLPAITHRQRIVDHNQAVGTILRGLSDRALYLVGRCDGHRADFEPGFLRRAPHRLKIQ